MNWFKRANEYLGYHGSPKDFQEFSYNFMGTNGTSEGFGFYFTNKEDIARGYANNGGVVKKALLTINKPLNPKKLSITPSSFANFLRALDPDGQGYLSNWGESDLEGYERVLRKAVQGEMSGISNDVDLISSVIQASGRNAEHINSLLKQVLGYDGIIISKPDWGNGITIYVVFDNSQIKYTD